MSRYYQSLPDIDEASPAPRRPHIRMEGTYVYKREPMESEVYIHEPPRDDGSKGDSYELSIWEAQIFTRNILRLDEEQTNQLFDWLWNFYRVSVTVAPLSKDVTRPTPAAVVVPMRDRVNLDEDYEEPGILEGFRNADLRGEQPLRS